MLKTQSSPFQVVVVDDSPTVRELLVAILEEAGGFQVIGVGANGEDAVRLVKQLRPHVLVMDIRMPRLDGLQATRQIMCEVPTPIVIVTGSLIHADRDITFEALREGALTVVRTPSLADREACRKVAQTVRLMAEVPVVHRWSAREPAAPAAPAAPHMPLSRLKLDGRPEIAVIGIAASTGGPSALATLLNRLPADYPIPILVVQHITRGFIEGLADWLGSESKVKVRIANHGDALQPGTVLLAPDNYHLQVSGLGMVELGKEPAYKGLRPSANFMFRSLAQIYGPRAIGIVLTGMGDDGAEGLELLRRAGGLTLAQDEATCVVYGMPYEAVARQAVERILSPEQIASFLMTGR